MSFSEFEDAFVWTCDDCGKQVTFKPHHFYDCVDELKERGWGFSRDEEGWRHWCPRHRRSLKDWMNEVPKGAVKVVK